MSGQQGESWKSCKQEKTLDLCCAKTTLTAGVEQGQGWGKARARARPGLGQGRQWGVRRPEKGRSVRVVEKIR